MTTTLLAVDDSKTMRKVLEITFAGEDFRTLLCATADEALAKLGEHPQIALVDAGLENAAGYELPSTADIASRYYPGGAFALRALPSTVISTSVGLTPSATTAFQNRAPSMWSGTSRSWAMAATSIPPGRRVAAASRSSASPQPRAPCT